MITFKSPRIENEFKQLYNRNPRLQKVLEIAARYCELEFKKDIVITSLYRDPQENKDVGGIATSPHMTWEAADLRSFTFTDEELAKLAAFLNGITFRNGKKTCVYHKVAGGAYHLHIQVAK